MLATALSYQLAFLQDDAFITFRYAANIADGLGPVWEPGNYVQGYSNPLWTFTLAAGRMMGFPIETSAIAIGGRDRRSVCASSLSTASARASEAASAARNLAISEALVDMAKTYLAGIGKPMQIRPMRPINPPLQGVGSSVDCASRSPPKR